jgi:hypothetical protein
VFEEFGIPSSMLSDSRNGKHPRKSGGQESFNFLEEKHTAVNIATLGDWGYPLDILELRMLVRDYLQAKKKTVTKFSNNIPGKDWVKPFLLRQHSIITDRMCRNICTQRGQLTKETLRSYF